MSEAEPHSQLYFTDARDHWWNADYVELLARRFDLGGVRRVLDVGSGQGHFARLWAPHLAPGFEVVCLDREARSLAVAERRCAELVAERALDGRFTFQVGSAERLPFPDDAFDLVMCQTVLIHVVDPVAVVAEMTRVTRPGGRVLAAEPNNCSVAQRLAARGPEASPEPMLRELRFLLTGFHGKQKLGLGWTHLGVHLGRYFAALEDARYYENDRPFVLAPPYATPAERAHVADFEDHDARGIWGWEREEARRYFVAGGGDVSTFDAEYDAMLRVQSEEVAAMRAGTWWELEASVLFVGSGRKPRRT